MNKYLVWLMLLTAGCTKSELSEPLPIPSFRSTDTGSGPLISVSQADTMIFSYLLSINKGGDSSLKSWTLDAAAFRRLLSDTTVHELKIMLAHTPEQIQNHGMGKYAGYHSDALSLVITGVNRFGDYVLTSEGMAINKARRCPPKCPTGTAGHDLISY